MRRLEQIDVYFSVDQQAQNWIAKTYPIDQGHARNIANMYVKSGDFVDWAPNLHGIYEGLFTLAQQMPFLAREDRGTGLDSNNQQTDRVFPLTLPFLLGMIDYLAKEYHFRPMDTGMKLMLLKQAEQNKIGEISGLVITDDEKKRISQETADSMIQSHLQNIETIGIFFAQIEGVVMLGMTT